MDIHRDTNTENGDDRPRHPTKQAIWLLIGVTLLLVVLAVLSSIGQL